LKDLFSCAEIRLIAQSLGIKKIEANIAGGKFEFKELPNIDPLTIIKMVQKNPSRYQLSGPSKLIFKAECKEAKTRIKAVQEILKELSGTA
jgi:transcription-repair coupling factor (superfamily II helicase)